jgi:branched-chain amino acid transport system ATP-binding protein
MSDALLHIDDLWAGYGSTEVVRGVSLDVAEGECVGIVGPNGHGKTTLLHATAGLLRPWAGSVWFDGDEVTDDAVFRRSRAGLVHIPQGDLLFGELSVEDNLLAAAQGMQWRRRGELLRDVFSVFPILEERRRQTAGTMSGGQRRMLAIGRGLMMRTRLMLVDEPSLGLAPRVVADVYSAVRALLERGVALVVVEENPQRLRGLAASSYLIEAGVVVKHGSLDQVLADEQLAQTYLGVGSIADVNPVEPAGP